MQSPLQMQASDPAAGDPHGWLARLDRAAERASGWLQTGSAVAAFIAGLCLLQFVLRSWVFPGGTNDDSEQYLYSQAFSLGYQHSNPPLFTWLLIAVQQVIGQVPMALHIVKTSLFAIFFASTYLVAREITADRRFALAAAVSPFAIYYVAFDAMRTYTHSIALMAAVMATLALVYWLRRSTSLWPYLALGLALGLGTISKYNFLLFTSALLLAGLLDPQLRARLLDRRMLIAVALALAVMGPNLYWLIENAPAINAKLQDKLTVDDSAGGLTARLEGLGAFLAAGFNILLPLLLLLPLCFPRSLLPREASLIKGPDAQRSLAGQALLGNALLILFVGCFLAILIGGFDRISNHYMLIFLPAPLWFFARASRIEAGSGGLHRFFTLAMVLALVAASAIVIKFLTDPLEPRRRPYNNVPYAEIAEALQRAGFAAGTVYAYDNLFTVSGHLRRYFPESRFLSLRHNVSPAPERAEPGQCLILWYEKRPGETPAIPSDAAYRDLGIDPQAPQSEGFVEAPFVNGWGRTFKLSYRLVDEAAQRCR